MLIYSECHLQNQEINYTLAVLEGPKERVLKQFSIHHGCPEDRATTIAKYLMNPISEESKKWSKLYLNENWSFDYELLASAYIEGINRKPPDERISNILFEYNIPYVGQPREYAGFSMNLPGICNKPSYPVVEIDPRYRDYAFKGMKCQLSKQETNQFISMIKEDIKKNPNWKTSRDVNLYTPIKAYFNQTGDLDFFQYLWDRECEGLCLKIASMMNDPEIVKLALDLTQDLDLSMVNEKGDLLRMGVLGLFNDQKNVPEVGYRLRDLVKNPGLYDDYIQYLVRILGDRGWSENEYYINKSTLEQFQTNHDIMTKIIKNTMNMINVRIKNE